MFDIELPPGGWADKQTFDGILRRTECPSNTSMTGGATHRTVPALSRMFRFADETHEYALLGKMRTGYDELRRRPKEPTRKLQGWTSERSTSERVARIRRPELQQSIQAGIIDALSTGVAATLDPTRFHTWGDLPRVDPVAAEIRALTRKVEDTSTQLARAMRNAELAEGSEAADLFVDRVNELSKERSKLQTQLDTLNDRTEPEPELPDSFTTTAGFAANALAVLGAQDLSVPREAAEALATILSDTTLRVVGDEVEWSLNIELPYEDGTIILGPVVGRVPNHRPNKRTRECLRKLSLLDELLDHGCPPGAAQLLVSCPHPDLARCVLGPTAAPTLDAQWAKHIADVYSTEPRWSTRWREDQEARQGILDTIKAHGGSATKSQLANFSTNTLRYLCRPGRTDQSVIRTTGRAEGRRYHLHDCPHCDGQLDTGCLTPETPDGLLCSTCMRSPAPDSPVFPDWYRNLGRQK